MTRLIWWLRMVGGFNLLLALLILDQTLFDPPLQAQTLPISADPLSAAIRALTDSWQWFVFELGISGAMALYASRQPERSGTLTLSVIWAEVFRGAVADAIWMRQGYAASSYVPLAAVHLSVIAVGLWFLWEASAKSSGGRTGYGS